MALARSPFPGMDPYLEAHWQAVHAIFIAETWRALNRLLPGDLSATVEERVAVESEEDHRQLRAGPDVFVFEPSYRVTIRTAGIPATVYLYPICLQNPLPEIQIPLRLQDPKLILPLQPMIETIYADGRYGKTLDYTRPLDPPLPVDDQSFDGERTSAVA